MKPRIHPPILVALLGVALAAELSAQTTAFTYQGRVQENGQPAEGPFDIRFIFYNAESGGSQVGATLTNDNVVVLAGLLTTAIHPGAGVFTGADRWLEIAIRPGDSTGSFTLLDPRQPLTALPYALYAPASGTATTADSAGSALSAPWSGLTGVPPGFADGADADTTYSAGGGLGLSGTTFSIAPGGVGTVQLADGAVTGIKIADGAITDSDISLAAGISAAKIAHGPGSGLDADRLDGSDSTAFASSAHNHYGASWFGNAFTGLRVATTNSSSPGIAAIEGVEGGGRPVLLGSPVAVWGNARDGIGLYGSSSNNIGVLAHSDDNVGVVGSGVNGVRGFSTRTTGLGFGVYGQSEATSGGAGVYGTSVAATGTAYGVFGTADSPSGVGIYGRHAAATGTSGGVEGWTDSISDNAVGVLGRVENASPGSFSAGVRGVNTGTGGNGIGVYGSQNGGGWGVFGISISGVGVRAESVSGNPLEAWGNNNRRFYVANNGSVFADGPYSGAGADFAELLPAHDGLEPGDVLVVDEEGKLARSSRQHQESVVGVYSTKPGFIGGAGEGADLSGRIPLAIVGIVPVKVTNENGPIRPGNLLTSSSLAGHAMRTDASARAGTVLGKALTPFDGERGTIQALVTLQ